MLSENSLGFKNIFNLCNGYLMKKNYAKMNVLLMFVLVTTLFFTGCETKPTYEDGYIKGFKDARDAAIDAGLPVNMESRVLTGTVLDVGQDSLKIDVQGLVMDELVDGVGTERTVIITDDTEIVKFEEKDIEQFFKEQEEFDKALSEFDPETNGGQPPEPPSNLNEASKKLTDLGIGDRVKVEASDESNLIPLESFTAAKITVLMTPLEETDISAAEAISEESATPELRNDPDLLLGPDEPMQ